MSTPALRMSSLFLRTLREDPADAELPSHRLLVRAGYIRRVAPGIYTWLPLGLRVLRNIERIVREEMDAIGAQELSFPALLPKEPFEASAVDGANWFYVFRRLMLPMMWPYILVAVIFRFMDCLKIFDIIYAVSYTHLTLPTIYSV